MGYEMAFMLFLRTEEGFKAIDQARGIAQQVTKYQALPKFSDAKMAFWKTLLS